MEAFWFVIALIVAWLTVEITRGLYRYLVPPLALAHMASQVPHGPAQSPNATWHQVRAVSGHDDLMVLLDRCRDLSTELSCLKVDDEQLFIYGASPEKVDRAHDMWRFTH
jgi:hypothetical protein